MNTGELSADMLLKSGAEYVIIGHSERRQYFGETDATVNQRVKAAVAAGLKVILCVGEKKEEREVTNTLAGTVMRYVMLSTFLRHSLFTLPYTPLYSQDA